MKFSLRHQSAGKIYPYIEVLSHTMYWGFFRKVHLHNRSGVPSDKPVLLAANHPTAFVDPCLLCSYLNPPIYNMTRGDIFEKPFYRRLMESINMFPVYRARDGYSGRDRNDAVFDFCVDKLREHRVVTIYVEGEHHLEKRVRPAHKGIARIAFAAFERHRLEDLQIIPAGCNYRFGDRPRDEVMVNIGTPIYVKDYWDDYSREPAGTISRLCNDIEIALKSICYHIEDRADDALSERLLAMLRSEYPPAALPLVTHNDGRFFREKALLDRLNSMPLPEKNDLREKTERYFESLGQAGLQDDALMNPQWAGPSRLLFLAGGLIPFLAGYISSWPLIRLAKYVADKKVKKPEFYTSVRMGVGFLAGVPYYFALLLASFLSGAPGWMALGMALPLLGWFSLVYKEAWVRWRTARAATRSPFRRELLRMRKSIPAEFTVVESKPAGGSGFLRMYYSRSSNTTKPGSKG